MKRFTICLMLVLLFVVSSFAGNRKDKLLEIERDVKSNLAVLQHEMGKGSYADLDKVRSALSNISEACLELKSYGIALQVDCADQRQSAKDLRDSAFDMCELASNNKLLRVQSGGRGNSLSGSRSTRGTSLGGGAGSGSTKCENAKKRAEDAQKRLEDCFNRLLKQGKKSKFDDTVDKINKGVNTAKSIVDLLKDIKDIRWFIPPGGCVPGPFSEDKGWW